MLGLHYDMLLADDFVCPSIFTFEFFPENILKRSPFQHESLSLSLSLTYIHKPKLYIQLGLMSVKQIIVNLPFWL